MAHPPFSQLPLDPDARAGAVLAEARRGAAPGELPPEAGASPSAPPADAPGPLHEPHACRNCGAPIFWAATLGQDGRRVPGPGGRWKAMPVDAEPAPGGNVVLFHREGEGIVARVLHKGEEPPAGARLRTSHFATCPNANQHRRSR